MKKLLLILLFLFIFPVFCFADFTDNGDTITDNDTGLIWMKATAPDSMTWEDALSYCDTLTLAGESDWRLPTVKELQSIVDYESYNPTIDVVYFPDTEPVWYWSSTSYFGHTDHAWAVYFYYGYVEGQPKSFHAPHDPRHVRAVRGGE